MKYQNVMAFDSGALINHLIMGYKHPDGPLASEKSS